MREGATTWSEWLATKGTQPSSPICSLTSQLTRETLLGQPTPRSTRVAASSRPQSRSRLRRRRRSGSLCARSHSSLLTSGPPPASSSCRVLYDLATPWSFQPACGRPTHAKSSEAQGGQPPYAASTDRQPESLSMSRRRAMVGPMKTSCCHSTISEWQSSNRPDFPPASPCGNREFWADVPHRNRDHRAYGAVRRVHSFFPYNVTDARRWVLCVARYVFLQRTFKPRGDRVGALGGQYGRRSTPRQLRCHRPTPRQLRVEGSGLPYLATALRPSGALAAPSAPRSEFRACERDPPPSPCHLQCLLAYTCGITEPTVRCVVYIHSFPTTSRTQEGLVVARAPHREGPRRPGLRP